MSFFLWRRDPVLGLAAISSALAHSSVVFCNSMSADHIVMAVSKLLGATAVRIMLLAFAAGHRKL